MGYKTKLNFDGSMKNSIAAKRLFSPFRQQGVEFSGTFALVARNETIIATLAAKLWWKITIFMLSQHS